MSFDSVAMFTTKKNSAMKTGGDHGFEVAGNGAQRPARDRAHVVDEPGGAGAERVGSVGGRATTSVTVIVLVSSFVAAFDVASR